MIYLIQKVLKIVISSIQSQSMYFMKDRESEVPLRMQKSVSIWKAIASEPSESKKWFFISSKMTDFDRKSEMTLIFKSRVKN